MFLAELRTNECFSMEAPIVRQGDTFYQAGQLFKDGKLNEELLQRIIA